MNTSVQAVLLLTATAAVLVATLHVVLWRLLVGLSSATARLPRLQGSRAWARMRPVQAWLSLRHPLLYAHLRARLDPSTFAGLPLTMLVVAATYIVALLSGLTEEVVEAGGVLRLDQAVNAAFAAWREPLPVAAFLWITALGTGSALTGVALAATGFLWADRRSRLIVPLWMTFIGAQATTWAGKFAVARHRPEFIDAVQAASPSFPSAHATGSMAVYGFLAYVLARDLPRREQRFEVVFWVGVLIAAIGFSRLFLSVHYATDIGAGFMVGGFWLLVGFVLAEHRRSVEQRTFVAKDARSAFQHDRDAA